MNNLTICHFSEKNALFLIIVLLLSSKLLKLNNFFPFFQDLDIFSFSIFICEFHSLEQTTKF